MRKLIALAFLALNLTACNQAIQDYVAAGGPSNRGPGSTPTPPVVPVIGPNILKIAPGAVMSTSSSISMKASVTATNQQFQSTSISGEISIHQQRVSH